MSKPRTRPFDRPLRSDDILLIGTRNAVNAFHRRSYDTRSGGAARTIMHQCRGTILTACRRLGRLIPMERLAGATGWGDLRPRVSVDTGWEHDFYANTGADSHTLASRRVRDAYNRRNLRTPCSSQIRNIYGVPRNCEVGLARLGLSDETLAGLPKGASEKRVLAWFVRGHTMVANAWLSSRLHCGHPANLSGYVRSVENATEPCIVELRNRVLKSED
jgi:hypothetical protein